MNFRHLGVLLMILPMVAAGPAVAGPSDPTLKRVMLSTGGVAYLEYEAQVTGDAELSLDVPLDQVDDVLKSIVVYDSKGGVGNASLAGRNPLSQTFNDLPFGEEALASPATLLNALQGAEIKVGSTRPITGQLLKVVPETVELANKAITTRNRVSVLTATGLQQFVLEDAESVSFTDSELQAKVSQALHEIAAHRAKDRRQIKLATHGDGTRLVRIGYVVGEPVWKASYRMTLPENATRTKAHLQGWAVLENMSGQDWKGVELTLLSGNPVTFRQAIYEAYYIDRPEVPVEVAGRILPKPDSGVMSPATVPAPEFGRSAAEPGTKDLRQQQSANSTFFQNPLSSGQISNDKPPAAPPLAALVDTADAVEGITQVSFRLPEPVTIASGQSAIVPLLDKDVPIVRLALYQPGTSAMHPLASVRMKNDGASGLPPGVLTLYEQSSAGIGYVGDARLGGLPAGEDRLLSYAVDEKTKVSREEQSESTLTRGSMSQGVMYLTRVVRQTTVYKLTGPAKEPRRVLLEQPKREGWKLIEPDEQDVEQTATLCRAALELKPGEAKSFKFVLEAPNFQGIRIIDVSDAQIAEVTQSGEIDGAIKKALAELVRLRRVAAEKQATEEQLKSRTDGLKGDQDRIRQNVATIAQDSALYKRYIEKLSAQETEFETLQAASDKAAEETRAARAAIDAYIAKLSI